MKRKFTFLIAAAVMLLTMMATTGRMWGQSKGEGDTHEFSQSLQQLLNNNASIASINIAEQSYSVKKVTISYRYNKTIQNAVTMEVTVNGTSWGTEYSTGTGSNYTTVDFEGASATGPIVISFTNNTGSGTGHGTFYVDNVILTEGTASGNTPSISAENVELAYDATGGSIDYTIDNEVTSGSLSAEVTSGDWLTLGTNFASPIAFTCEANPLSTERTATVTLTYTYTAKETVTKNVSVTQAGNPDAPGTENNPYTVAQARAAIDAGTGVTGVYATGIVSEIVTAYGTGGYNNVTFNIVDQSGDEEFLQAFRCVGDEAPNVIVNDEVVVYGNLTKYGSTYEFAQGCQVVSLEHPSTPYITADDVNITYDATEGNIAYTVENPLPEGQLTAATTSNWLTLSTDFASPIAFTCDANSAASSRTATVTLTYTYGLRTTVTKDVTVTQAGNPNVYNNISDITEVGTVYSVKGTVVATNSKGFIMGDGTGYVYAYLNAAPTVAVGDMITVSGTTGSYGHIIQFTGDATIAEATSSSYDGTPEVTVITEVPDYSEGYHLATYLQFEGGLTKSGNNYLVAVGSSQIRISYPTTEQGTDLEALENKTVRVHGFFSGISGSGTNAVFTATMESIEEVQSTEPIITVTPNTLNVNADAYAIINTFTISYENIEVENYQNFSIQFYDANNEETDQPDWIVVGVAGTNEEGYQVSGYIIANDGDARSTYFKVYALDTDANLVYSNIVTINQDEYVAPTYAELPFAFDGDKADIENTNGLSQEGLGGDYSASPKLKFDSTGDWLLLQFSERPGTLTFDIKGNSFSGGTFNVQTSEDGITYTDLETYTELGDTQNESFDNLGENVRYIKWIYTEKSSGNVGLGNIALAEYAEPTASITVDPATVNVTADGEDEGSLAIAYEYLTITDPADFDIQYYDANDEPLSKDDEPDWMAAAIQYTASQDGFEVSYFVDPNDGDARTAYFKVYALDDNTEVVYSNLVTVSQDAYVAPTATIAVTPETVNVEATGAEEGILAIAYENLTITDPADFDIQYYDANNEPLDKENEPDWMAAAIQYTATQQGFEVSYSVDPNDGDARTAFFKVYALDNNSELVYSNLVTINQAALVVDYATLPFEWAGGTTANFNALNGASTSGVGDYGDNQGVYRMKLDGTGDYIQVKTNEQPGIVTVGVKMIGGASTSTLTVQGSADGETFTDVEALTISGSQNTELTLETTNDFAATDRYVRLLFTKGSNVGVGPITIAQVDLTPSITVAPATLNLNADGGDGELTVTHKNLADNPQLNVIFVESDGETITTCDWIQASINTAGNVAGHINANTGEARTAYLKVTGRDAENNLIKSNLVTFNQSAYTEPSIVFENTTLDIVAGGENRTMSFDYEGLGQNPTFSINFYESDGTTAATYPWLTAVITPEKKVDITVSANEGAARSAYFKVSGVNGEVNALSNLVTINQAAYTQLATYSLVTSVDDIVSGKHYIIASSAVDGAAYAMGNQNGNNRKGYAVTVANEQITEAEGVYEFVINTNLNSNNEIVYTIYDAVTPGYLYASSSSANQLKTTTTLNDNGKWAIEISSTGAATITAQGSNSRKLMRYNPNNNSPIFACYATNTTIGNAPCLYVKDNDNNLEYYGTEITYPGTSIPDGGSITVGNGSVMTVPAAFTNTDPTSLIIEDGGQLVVSNPVAATMDKTYTKPSSWGNNSKGVNGWYLISSPVGTVNTSAVANLTPANSYDLYAYNEPDMMWYNAQGADHPFSQLVEGEGYLYSSKDGADAAYSGTVFCGSLTKTLSYEAANAEMKGWNLLGNPYSHNITWANLTPTGVNESGYYTLGFDGSWSAEPSTTAVIKPMQGFLVQATSAGAKVVFNNIAASAKSRSNNDFIAFTVANGQYEDVTYAMFEEGLGLNKINHRNSDIPMVYIPQNGQNYAIATLGDETQSFNLNFKAMTTGKYTLSYKAEGKYDYLHVIDRITGEDVDMLLDGEYSFMASAGDNDARFIVKLRYDANGNFDSDIFAYQNGNDVIVNGEGELQMFDLTGRMVANTMVNGVQTVNVPAQGVYIFRLVGNDVKTQKIVVR